MEQDRKTGRSTASFDEMALYSLVMIEAVSELLIQKGVLDADELKEKMEGIKKDVSLRIRRTP
jgi:hypothetical protein